MFLEERASLTDIVVTFLFRQHISGAKWIFPQKRNVISVAIAFPSFIPFQCRKDLVLNEISSLVERRLPVEKWFVSFKEKAVPGALSIYRNSTSNREMVFFAKEVCIYNSRVQLSNARLLSSDAISIGK